MKKIYISLFVLLFSFGFVNASPYNSYYDEVLRSEGCGVHFKLSSILGLPPYYCHRIQLLGGSNFGGRLQQACSGNECAKPNNIYNLN